MTILSDMKRETAGPRSVWPGRGESLATGGVAVQPASRELSPLFLAYLVAPLALVLLLVVRHFGFVAKVSPWAYVAAIGAAQVLGRLVERWADAPRGSVRLHVRVVVHVCRGDLGDLHERLGSDARNGVRVLGARGSAAVGRGCMAGGVGLVVDRMRGRSTLGVRGMGAVVLERVAGATIGLLGGVRVWDRDPHGRSDRGTHRSGRGRTCCAVRHTIVRSWRTLRKGSTPSICTARSSHSTPRLKRCSVGTQPRSSASRLRS